MILKFNNNSHVHDRPARHSDRRDETQYRCSPDLVAAMASLSGGNTRDGFRRERIKRMDDLKDEGDLKRIFTWSPRYWKTIRRNWA